VLLREVAGMKESFIYKAIVAQGRAEGALQEGQKILLLVGSKAFGLANKATRAAVRAIGDVQKLEELVQRVFDVGSWQELLGRPTPPALRRVNDAGPGTRPLGSPTRRHAAYLGRGRP
jgi:hypothetical protein